MATFTKLVLNGGSDGKNIQIVDTPLTPTTIHTTTGGSTVIDEIWLWGTNTANTFSEATVTINFGGTNPSDQVSSSLAPADGAVLLIPGWCLNGTDLVVQAYSNLPSTVNINGFVNRITP